MTRRQSREVDRIAIEEYGIPSLVLMENAAHGIYDVVITPQLCGDAVEHGYTVLCGKGNNGGDGLAVARLLRVSGRDVTVYLTDPPSAFTGDAATQLNILGRMGFSLEPADAFLVDARPFAGVLIDAIYGTGFRPPSRIDFRPLNERTRGKDAYVVAVDVPSGLDADTGSVDDGNAIVADRTVTMMTAKRGFWEPDAKRYTGEVWTTGLGIPFDIARRAAASPP